MGKEKPQVDQNQQLAHGANKVAPAASNAREHMLSLAEHATIQTLRAQGVSVSEIARKMNRDRRTISRYLTESARDIVTGNLDEYARLHLEASKVAASKGDGRPMEWAMERANVVEVKAQPTESKGFTVQIGVLLPHLGASAQLTAPADVSSQVIDAEEDNS